MIVDFEPLGRRVQVRPGVTLLSAARESGINMQAVCSGNGTCGRCRIRVISGNNPGEAQNKNSFFSNEDFELGWRLACKFVPEGDMKVYIPPESLTASQRLQLEGMVYEMEDDPVVFSVEFEPDYTRSRAGLPDDLLFRDTLIASGIVLKKIRYSVLKSLSDVLRQEKNVRLKVKKGNVIGVLTPGESLLGIAIDAGTTKLAGYLMNLETGKILSQKAVMNPQIAYGEDIVSRIAYCAQHSDGRAALRSVLLEELNMMIRGMCEDIDVPPEDVLEAVIVGNTAVHHLLCGFPVQQLGLSPYVPSIGEAFEVGAAEFGLKINHEGTLFFPENIAGYVGGDHTAMLLATEAERRDGVVLALDIGTNTEVTLSAGNRSLSCSCASGPAFEGAHIRDGMRAAEGAVEGVMFENGKFLISTIENKPALGLCGSGILDAVAELKKSGLIDNRGIFKKNISGITGEGLDKAFILVPKSESGNNREIVISRNDINEIQLAKAAIRSGIDILLKKMDIEEKFLDRVIIAGAFGTYLNIESAIKIGMFPHLDIKKFHQVGNAAGAGARQMLLSSKKRAMAGEIAGNIEFVELNSEPGFRDIFMKNMYMDG